MAERMDFTTKLELNTRYVRELLIHHKMSYSDLAERMHISRNTLRKYINHPEKASLEMINNMARALKQPDSRAFIKERDDYA